MDDEKAAETDSFVEDRFRSELEWFERRAFEARRRHLVLQSAQVIVMLIVPTLLILLEQELFTYSRLFLLSATVLSFFTVVLTMYMQAARFDARWLQSRLVAEQLKREYFSYRAGIGEYAALDPLSQKRVFAERTASLIESERSKWYAEVPRGET